MSFQPPVQAEGAEVRSVPPLQLANGSGGNTSRSRDRLRPFRLADVPLAVRVRVANRLILADGDSRDGVVLARSSNAEAMEIGLAANHPSNRVYWISERAWQRVMKGAA